MPLGDLPRHSERRRCLPGPPLVELSDPCGGEVQTGGFLVLAYRPFRVEHLLRHDEKRIDNGEVSIDDAVARHGRWWKILDETPIRLTETFVELSPRPRAHSGGGGITGSEQEHFQKVLFQQLNVLSATYVLLALDEHGQQKQRAKGTPYKLQKPPSVVVGLV